MPSVQLDRSVQKRCDAIFASASLETKVEYGLLIASGHADDNTFLCVAGALKVPIDDDSEISKRLLSSAEVLDTRLCGGIHVVGFYAFVLTAGVENILSMLENTLNSLSTRSSKRVVITLTSNRTYCKIAEEGSSLKPGEIKLVDLRNQYAAVVSNVFLDLRLSRVGKSFRGSSLRKTLGTMFDDFYDAQCSQSSTVVKIDGRVLPVNLAKNVSIGELPEKRSTK